MVFYDDDFSGRAYIARINAGVDSQSIAGNTSRVSFALEVKKNGADGSQWAADPSRWWVEINGAPFNGTWSYDFRSTDNIVIATGVTTVAHSADGSKTIVVAATVIDDHGYLGSASTSGNYTLPTIPRTSNPTLSPASLDAGTTMTITTNRASSSFTHTVSYTFGSATGTIATGVGASTTWTPPLSLLNQIPNAASGTGTITTKTYSGSTLIGTATDSFTLKAPTSVKPAFTDVTALEATAGVDANVGKFVQNISKLALAINSPTAPYGATIKTYKITVAGQTINARTGTTSAIATSGTMSVVGTVTDSRGRTYSDTLSISVLPYAPPSYVSTPTVKRALSTGVLDDEGTYAKISLNAAVASLINSTQRNELDYAIQYKLRTSSTWSTATWVTPTAGAVTFNNTILVGAAGSPFLITQAYDFLITVRDDFSNTAKQLVLSTSTIFMHWDAGLGVGIGKYRQNGALDVQGDGYLSGKVRLGATGDVSLTSTTHGFQIGADNASNLAMDTNEIQARDNGTAGSLVIQNDGGNLTLGGANTDVDIPSWLKFWSLRGSSAQAIATGTWTKYTNWATVQNNNGGITYASGVFTVPVNGWYFINAQVKFATTGTGQRTCRLSFSNGTDIEAAGNVAATGVASSTNITLMRYMAAGESFELDVYQSQGVAISTISGDNTFLQIGLIYGT